MCIRDSLKPVAQKVKNSQDAKKSFVKYDLFTVNEAKQTQNLYKSAAEDVTVMQLNKLACLLYTSRCV